VREFVATLFYHIHLLRLFTLSSPTCSSADAVIEVGDAYAGRCGAFERSRCGGCCWNADSKCGNLELCGECGTLTICLAFSIADVWCQ
jgi:hypothetical protein